MGCKAYGCTRDVKSSGLCHVHLKEAAKPRTLSIGTSDFSAWQKRQNLERSWQKPVTANHRHARARRKRTEAIAMATPVWLSPAQLKQIEGFYEEARVLSERDGERYEVDHIIPLHGDDVCGLHVPWNMQVLKKSENNAKGNRR